MVKLESVQEYLWKYYGSKEPFHQFRAGKCELQHNIAPLPYHRRDFFQIKLFKSPVEFQYAGRKTALHSPSILLSNPYFPYAIQSLSERACYSYCIFTETFLDPQGLKSTLGYLPLFNAEISPLYTINDTQLHLFSVIFEQLIKESASDYHHKLDLLRHYVFILLHEIIKLQSEDADKQPVHASQRICAQFLKLLTSQFPITAAGEVMKLRHPVDFAKELSVHINHLNHVVQEATGKSTGRHIAEKILKEAQDLLKNTDWTIADIAACLGFEYPSYFNSFFKKHIGLTPLNYRKSIL